MTNKDDFFNQLDLAESTIRSYKVAYNSTFLRNFLIKECGKQALCDIVDLETLWQLYSKVNLHPKNVSNHRIYSCVIMKYIRFLNNGKKIGKRIDFGKSKYLQ